MLTDLIDKFVEWHQSISEEVSHVYDLLSKELSDEPSELVRQLSEVEAWNSRTGYWLAEANSFLDRFNFAYLPEKGERSEKERLVKLECDVADYRKVRDRFEVLQNSIKQKLILGESLLNYHRQFVLKPIQEKPF